MALGGFSFDPSPTYGQSRGGGAPSAGNGTTQPSPQQAVKVLNLRIPRRPAFGGIAPQSLLLSPGLAGAPGIENTIRQLAGIGAAVPPASQPPVPVAPQSAPPNAPIYAPPPPAPVQPINEQSARVTLPGYQAPSEEAMNTPAPAPMAPAYQPGPSAPPPPRIIPGLDSGIPNDFSLPEQPLQPAETVESLPSGFAFDQPSDDVLTRDQLWERYGGMYGLKPNSFSF